MCDTDMEKFRLSADQDFLIKLLENKLFEWDIIDRYMYMTRAFINTIISIHNITRQGRHLPDWLMRAFGTFSCNKGSFPILSVKIRENQK